MSERLDRVSRGIKSFVENPIPNLVKGLALVAIGVSEASRTFQEDLAHGRVRLGHGLIIIGFFSILASLPDLIAGMEAGERYLETRAKNDRPEEEAVAHES